jgi:hypothetical protein
LGFAILYRMTASQSPQSVHGNSKKPPMLIHIWLFNKLIRTILYYRCISQK